MHRSPIHRTENSKQDNGTNCRHDDVPEHAVRGNTEHIEEETTNDGTDNTDYKMTNEAETCAFNQHISQPTGNESDNEEPENFHKYWGKGQFV
jgi:hypothetical protein